MIAKIYYFTFNALNNLVLVFLTLAMLKDMLDNIVAKLVLGQGVKFCKDLIQNRTCLRVLTVL
jgi:hypothetical protein